MTLPEPLPEPPPEPLPPRRRGAAAREATLADRAVDLGLRGAVAAARALPWERRVVAFGALVRHLAGPLGGYRRRALDNLALARPGWSEARRRAVAEACLDNFGRTLIENYSSAELARRLRGAPLTGGGLPHLEAARAEGRPVILLTGHFGNHEAPRHALSARGFELGGLYRPMRNPLVNRHYVATIEGVSGPVFPQGRAGTAGFVRHLARGGMGVLLFDLHVAGAPEIPFLGRPARTSLAGAELARRHGGLLMTCWGVRRPDGLGFDCALEEPIPEGEPLAMMAEATRRLEARVEAHPEQWFWVHRRWKA